MPYPDPLHANMPVFSEYKAALPPEMRDAFMAEFLRLANLSDTMKRQLWALNDEDKTIRVDLGRPGAGYYKLGEGTVYMGLPGPEKQASDPFAPDGSPAPTYSPVQVFIGILAHELGHKFYSGYQGDITTKYPATNPGNYMRRVVAGVMSGRRRFV